MLYLLLIAVIAVVDQIIKYVVANQLGMGNQIEVILFAGVPAGAVDDALADGIVLQLQGAVNTAAVGIKGDAAQMAGQIPHGAQGLAGKIGLQQNGGEGKVDVPARLVDGDALDVTLRPVAAVDTAGEVV